RRARHAPGTDTGPVIHQDARLKPVPHQRLVLDDDGPVHPVPAEVPFDPVKLLRSTPGRVAQRRGADEYVMVGRAHLLQSRPAACDLGQVTVKALAAHDRIDRRTPFRLVLLTSVKSAPIGGPNGWPGRKPGAERIKEPLLEIGQD